MKTLRPPLRTAPRARQVVHVAVADTRGAVLNGLAQMVNKVPGFRADVLVHNGDALLRACKAEQPPDVALVQAELDNGRGVQAMVLLHNELPQLPVLLLCERADAPLAQQAIRAGAAGLLCTDLDDGAMATALHEVRAVGFHMNAVLRTCLGSGQVAALRSGPRTGHGLTRAELSVIQLCADRARYTQREVARRADVGLCTVRTHLQRIRRKWKVKTTGAAVRRAVYKQWVQ